MTSQNPSRIPLTAEALTKAMPSMAMSTRAIHADDFSSSHRAIAPAMHVAVNYRYARDPEELVQLENRNPNDPADSHIYSRYSNPNSTRFETVLKSLFGGAVMTYSTGLAAFHAVMVLLNPRRVFIGDGYHGVHGVIGVISKLNGVQKLSLDQLDQLQPGDLVHVETPVNPTGEAKDIAHYSSIAHKAGAYLTVDATFGPPPLQDPLQFGADIVFHSGTKYIGGHSDMMCGILVVHESRVAEGWLDTLYSERLLIGGVMGSLEGWLGLRSLRTLELRISRQSATAEVLVKWLSREIQNESSIVSRVVGSIRHASIQEDALQNGWLRRQMPRGYGPVFAIWLKSAEHAKKLPSKMFIFQHATSIGDVESLMEWRAMSDNQCDQRLVRISCGLEDMDDLRQDLLQGFQSL